MNQSPFYQTVSFDQKKLASLKRAQAKAIKEGKSQYVFDGHDLLVSYAKYLIEHLENTLRA